MHQLVLGGARSGKSAYAEAQAAASRQRLVYLATAEAGDAEMAQRIAHHRSGRDPGWLTVEEPLALAAQLAALNEAHNHIVVDCLTLWLSNCLATGCWEQQREALLALLPEVRATLYLVSNEVGSGVVPLGELSRRFVDESGRLHQQLATHCDRVTLVVAGLPLTLK